MNFLKDYIWYVAAGFCWIAIACYNRGVSSSKTVEYAFVTILVFSFLFFLAKSESVKKYLDQVRGARRPKRSRDNELGSSDFATSDAILQWTRREGELDTILPVTNLRGSEGLVLRKGNIVWPNGERNRHILIIAKTGSGKTTRLILPILYSDCMSKERSTIIIDSKPEMWEKLAGMTAKYNPSKKILLFNPLDTLRTLSWNILAKVENDTDAKLIANTIIQATEGPNTKADSPFFKNNALQLLNAIFVGLLEDPDERISMPRTHQLVHSGKENLCQWLEAHQGAIRITRTFVELARSGSQNADTVLSELGMRLAAWDLKAIRASTFAEELDLETVVSEPTLLIIELRESEIEMLRPMANVIVVEVLRYLTKRAENCPGVTLPRPVSLVIDEFASAIGRLPDIHVKLNTLRSRNVSIVAAIQSIGQIKANYDKDGDSVLSGFSSKILMPAIDFQDAEWASKETGTMTIRYRTKNTGSNKRLPDTFASYNKGAQEQVQQRAVLTPDEIGRPSDNIATFFMPNTPVFQGFLTPYYKDPEMVTRIGSGDSNFSPRKEPLDYRDPTSVRGKPMTEKELRATLEDAKSRIGWAECVGVAHEWWLAFEEQNKEQLPTVLTLCDEIEKRQSNISDFFIAYVNSGADSIPGILQYMDKTKEEDSTAGSGVGVPKDAEQELEQDIRADNGDNVSQTVHSVNAKPSSNPNTHASPRMDHGPTRPQVASYSSFGRGSSYGTAQRSNVSNQRRVATEQLRNAYQTYGKPMDYYDSSASSQLEGSKTEDDFLIDPPDETNVSVAPSRLESNDVARRVHVQSYMEMAQGFISDGNMKDYQMLIEMAQDDPLFEESDLVQLEELARADA